MAKLREMPMVAYKKGDRFAFQDEHHELSVVKEIDEKDEPERPRRLSKRMRKPAEGKCGGLKHSSECKY